MDDVRSGISESSDESGGSAGRAKVIDLSAFRSRRQIVGERSSGVTQAFRTTAAGSQFQPLDGEAPDLDLAERIERIKSSINRINQLMAELRNISDNGKSRNSPG